MNTREIVKQNLKTLRKKHRYTNRLIAEAIEVPYAMYRSYEEGRASVPVDLLAKLVKVYGVEYKDLIETLIK